jgi:hypothetical protein
MRSRLYFAWAGCMERSFVTRALDGVDKEVEEAQEFRTCERLRQAPTPAFLAGAAGQRASARHVRVSGHLTRGPGWDRDHISPNGVCLRGKEETQRCVYPNAVS